METFDIGMLVMPSIALLTGLGLSIYFYKKQTNKKQYKRLIASVGAIAFLLNFMWEVAQGFLYKGYKYDWEHISFCALASVADVLMVFILLFGFGLIYRNVLWIARLNATKIWWLMLAGFLGAIVAEMAHTSRGSWAYTESMPLIPWVDVGLTPVLQFTILPLIIFMVSIRILKRNNY